MSTTEGAFYYPPLENLPIFDVLVFRNAQDVTDFAINSENSLITNTTSGTPYYPTFVDSSSGYERIRTNNPSYTYNANTNTISANTSGTAAVATQVTVTDSTLQTIWYPTIVRAVGNQSVRIYSSQYTYDSLTNELSVNISGSAFIANQVLVQDDNTANTYYLTFATSNTLGTNKQIYIDSLTTPLSYVPSTNTLTVNNLSSVVAITPDNARNILLNGTPIGNGGNTTCVFMGTSAGPVGTAPNNNFCFGTGSGAFLSAGGVQNLCIGANSGNLLTSGNRNTFLGPSASRFATTAARNTTVGGASQGFPDFLITGSNNTIMGYDARLTVDPCNYTTIIGSEVTCGTSNTVQIGRAADTTIFDGTVTNTIAQPAASDSSTKMPTTAWVQTAITAGSVTNASQVSLRSDDTAGTYYIPFSKTNTATNNALYIDDTTTPLTYNPNTSTLTCSTASFTNPNITLNSGNLNIGHGAGSVSNIIIGASTPSTIVFTSGGNTLLGNQSGQNMTAAAANNTFLGNSTGLGTSTGVQNTFIGSLAGNQVSGAGSNNNTCVGYIAGTALISPVVQNTLIGSSCAVALTSGNGNTVLGFGAATGLIVGTTNTIIGVQAGDNITGSSNICIGSSSVVPTAAGSNQIAIGTINETMFLQGQLNYRIGTAIAAAVTLPTVGTTLAQFYSFSAGTAYTITLPVPTLAAYLGATVTFKRKTNATNIITFAAGAGTPFVPIGATAAAATIALAVTVFQITLICDGVNWCSISQA